MGDFGCKDHSQYAGGHRVHPDRNTKQQGYGDVLGDDARSAPGPKRHTSGKLAAQMNPDHGPHKGAGKHK